VWVLEALLFLKKILHSKYYSETISYIVITLIVNYL